MLMVLTTLSHKRKETNKRGKRKKEEKRKFQESFVVCVIAFTEGFAQVNK